MDKPILSKQAFWDVDMDKINYKKNALYVMENAINHRPLEDFVTLRKFYGDKKVREVIVNTKVFGPKEVNFCCLILGLKPQDFKYPMDKSAYSQPWDYSGA